MARLTLEDRLEYVDNRFELELVATHRVRQLAEQELGIPYLRIETDYSPSDSARIAVRVEALFETVRAGGPAQK